MPAPRSTPVRRPVLAALALGVTLALALGLAACTSPAPGPETAASRFLDALAGGDDGAAGATTDSPDVASAAISAARTGLVAQGVRAELGKVRASGDTATADFTAHWTLDHGRDWSYPGQLQLSRSGSDWSVRWSSADLHPDLGANQTLALRVDAPQRAAVLDSSGTEVLSPTDVVRVVLTPGPGVDVAVSANRLAGLLGPLVPGLSAASITGGVAATAQEVAVVRTSLVGDRRAQLDAIPGVSTTDESRLLATDPTFAPALLTEVGTTVESDLEGQAGWRVVTLGPTGSEVGVLDEHAPRPASAVTLSVDRQLQLAAQSAVAGPALPTAMVVLRPSTGDVLAVAQNGAADASGPLALQGLYPPGSTFKIITATAALEAGLSSAEAPIPCPSQTTIEDRTIGNINLFDAGVVPLKTAFARSCNTTFSRLASQLAPDGLTRAAQQLGVGVDYDVAGMTTVTGSIPPTDSTVLRAEDGFGQGQDQVTPFGMALAAASVANGSTAAPRLIAGSGTTASVPAVPLPAGPLGDLQVLTREVVMNLRLDAPDGTLAHGKTGEAQFGDGDQSHSWFVGYRGDLAFATLIVGGGGSDNAVAATRNFFAAVPDR